MFKPVRVVATLIFLGSIVLVFIGAYVIGSDVRTPLHILYHDVDIPLLQFRYCASVSFTVRVPCTGADPTFLAVFVIIEYLAYTWYTLSYIPYARAAVLKLFGM